MFATSCLTYKIPTTVDEIPDIELPPPTEIAKPEVEPAPIVVPTIKTVGLHIVSLTGFTKAQEDKFKKIIANCEIILNSNEFKQAILDFTYNGKKQFVSTTDSNEQVLEKLLSKDWPLEYRLEYRIYGKTIGYTLPSVTWIVIYTKFFNILSDAEIAGNIFHELGGHKVGRYGHDMKWSKPRDYSAPYGIGYVSEKIYHKMFMTE